ncbi:MAG: hypothetical protein JXA14_15810 [Anaerolineae bacterium]|nr:hypothetical protein [Anaerolineae bacterium]
MSRSLRLRGVGIDLLALAGYLLLTVLMTLPVPELLTTRLVGHGGDTWVHYWNNWWVGQALERGVTPYYTDLLFHPNGASLVYHNFGWVNIVGSLALKPLLGPVGAYNAVFLLNIVLCGYAMYDLARYLLGQRSAAFVAGLVHAFWPYRFLHVDHPNLICTQWGVWFLLYLIRTVREGRRHHVLLTALFLALTAFARLQLFVLMLFPAGIYVLYSLFKEREHWNRQTVLRLVAVGVLTGVVLAYPIFPLVREQLVGDYPDDLFIDEQSENQTDLLAFILPNASHPLRKAYFPNILETHVAFVGYTVLVVGFYGAIRAGRRACLWTWIAVFSFVMALGPYLRLGGKVYPQIPMPYRLVGWSFPVRVLRNPHRFNILLAIPAAVLVGYGIQLVSQSKWRARLIPLLVAGLVLFEYLRVPLPIGDMEYSPFYDQLAATSEQFGVYDLPMGFSGPAKFYMYLQTIHGKPIVQGKMARPTRSINDFIDGDPFTEGMRLNNNRIAPELAAVSRHLAYLADADVRYLIMHRERAFRKYEDYPFTEQWAMWQDWLTMEPYYQDDVIAVYHTRPRYGRDFGFDSDLGADVGIIRVGSIPSSLSQGDVVDLDIRWGSRATPGRDLMARLALVDEAGVVQQSLEAPPCADWPTGDWPSGAIAIGRYQLQVAPRLPPGRYALTAELVGVGQPAVLTYLDIESLQRTFGPPDHIGYMADARFGDDFRLLGYDLAHGDDALTLTLHWQALRQPTAYYKVFVHLFDPETQAVVAQDDAVPRRWTYPTTWWEAGEVVSDEIPLSLEEVPSGQYQLAVGVYDPETGDRLSVSVETLIVLSDALVLQEVMVP